jgi:hypothetical protein
VSTNNPEEPSYYVKVQRPGDRRFLYLMGDGELTPNRNLATQGDAYYFRFWWDDLIADFPGASFKVIPAGE